MSAHLQRLGAALLLMLAAGLALASAGHTQDGQGEPIVVTLPPDLGPEARDAFVKALGALERPVTVDGGAPTVTEVAPSELAVAMSRLDDALYGIVELPQAVAAWWRALDPAGGGAPWLALGAIVLALAVGGAVEWGVDRLLAAPRRRCLEAQPERFASRLGYALGWFGLQGIAVAAFAFGTFVGGWLLLPSVPGVLKTFQVLLIAIVKARIYFTIVELLFAPGHPQLRLVDMPDADARVVRRWTTIAIVAGAVVGSLLGIAHDTQGITRATGFLGLFAVVVGLAVRLGMFLGPRRQIRALVLASYADADGEVSTPVRVFAETWHLILSALAFVAFFVVLFSLLSLEIGGVTSVGSLVSVILLPFVLGAWSGLIHDLMIADAAGTRRAVIGGFVKTLGQGAILLVTFAVLGRSLGADPLAEGGGVEDRIAGALFEVGAAVLIGWALWSGVRVLLEQYAPADEEGEMSEDGMGKQGSRIETLLPVIRSFLLVTIIAITAMTALSAMGVQIGPLLAGAGVIGLAIGFGAQTLVTDVITGLFYLVEDAFRKGEYIECDAGKGVVEKISIRSIQLRHHRGPLNTIAFSKMGNVVNHSRDWVKIKFLLRVPFDTDLETVRKVIKKVGQDMLADPEVGHQFLAPVKSQGVMEVDDSGFVIGVKFVCRPGEQFVLRRQAYALIKQAFVENGIEFASRRVMVESETGGAQPAAAAAAALAPAAAGSQ